MSFFKDKTGVKDKLLYS